MTEIKYLQKLILRFILLTQRSKFQSTYIYKNLILIIQLHHLVLVYGFVSSTAKVAL